MSAHLQWMVVRNCSSFLIKRNHQTYSTVSAEPRRSFLFPFQDFSGPPRSFRASIVPLRDPRDPPVAFLSHTRSLVGPPRPPFFHPTAP
uniref:Uncharacterized protein n=1 Tax=Meleagris gallopavo TaxID=9103 RepID=A0A803YDD8_MELGA